MPNNFFDFQERMQRKPRAAKAAAATPAGDGPLTVSQLTAKIDQSIKLGLPESLLVQGEVSNFKLHSASGHIYFTLKDPEAAINCVMWKSDAVRLKFDPEDGMELIARGRVAVYPTKGQYQLYATSLQPVGMGALEVAFKQLCAKLEKEGLFDAERKRPIPRFARHIVLVTSIQTAALQDMLKVLRRFAWLKLYLYHVPVQGEGSAEKIAGALDHLSRHAASLGGIDVILLARGGGSLEDLWQFNEEILARAIVRSKIPIVTGIGHEVDVSIADLVADYHAHTPTEAAQVITTHWRTAKDLTDVSAIRLRRGAESILQFARQRLAAIERHEAFRRPGDRINILRQLLDERQRTLAMTFAARLSHLREKISTAAIQLTAHHPRNRLALAGQQIASAQLRLSRGVQFQLQRQTQRVSALERQLRAVGPEQVLQRGYSITTIKKTGVVLRTTSQIKGGEELLTRLGDGQVESTAEDPKQPGLF